VLLSRQRETLVEEAAIRIQRMAKALSEMNLKLHTVLTDITGQTGLMIVRDILKGERDRERLATYRDPRCHAWHAENHCRANGQPSDRAPVRA
jgi:transposase